jgi:hypothetical protein
MCVRKREAERERAGQGRERGKKLKRIDKWY